MIVAAKTSKDRKPTPFGIPSVSFLKRSMLTFSRHKQASCTALVKSVTGSSMAASDSIKFRAMSSSDSVSTLRKTGFPFGIPAKKYSVIALFQEE